MHVPLIKAARSPYRTIFLIARWGDVLVVAGIVWLWRNSGWVAWFVAGALAPTGWLAMELLRLIAETLIPQLLQGGSTMIIVVVDLASLSTGVRAAKLGASVRILEAGFEPADLCNSRFAMGLLNVAFEGI